MKSKPICLLGNVPNVTRKMRFATRFFVPHLMQLGCPATFVVAATSFVDFGS
jgi:hypothetical protein